MSISSLLKSVPTNHNMRNLIGYISTRQKVEFYVVLTSMANDSLVEDLYCTAFQSFSTEQWLKVSVMYARSQKRGAVMIVMGGGDNQ